MAFESSYYPTYRNDTSRTKDIIVWDRLTSRATRESVSSNGVRANGPSQAPAISRDGRYVAFLASNFATTDFGGFPAKDTNLVSDIYRRDRQANRTMRVSRLGSGDGEPNGASYRPAISADGQRIVFHSFASNLIDLDTNGFSDVIEWQRYFRGKGSGPNFIRLSADKVLGAADAPSDDAAISADGEYAAFETAAGNFGFNAFRQRAVFVHRYVVGECSNNIIFDSFGDQETDDEATDEALTGSGSPTVPPEQIKRLRAEFENKVKPAWWKREANLNPGAYSAKDLSLMRRGKAATGPDGFPYELHHKQPLMYGGSNDFSNLVKMTRTEHRIRGNFRLNHPRPRAAGTTQRGAYVKLPRGLRALSLSGRSRSGSDGSRDRAGRARPRCSASGGI